MEKQQNVSLKKIVVYEARFPDGSHHIILPPNVEQSDNAENQGAKNFAEYIWQYNLSIVCMSQNDPVSPS